MTGLTLVFMMSMWPLVHLGTTHLLYFVLGLVWIYGFGVSVALHRVFAHRTHQPRQWLKILLLVCGTMSCEGSTILWCALHRGTHHPSADTVTDPQSPSNNHGWWMKLQGWKIGLEKHIKIRTVQDLLRDPYHQWFHTNYCLFVWIVWLCLFFLIPRFFIFGILFPTFISVWMNNIENVISHLPSLGYRNFGTRDESTNVWWMWPFGWGACALHNNHHQFPGRYNFAHKWWEIDPSMIFLPLLKLGSIRRE
jgi:fatty-acid desaturase